MIHQTLTVFACWRLIFELPERLGGGILRYGKPSCGPAANGGWRRRKADLVGAPHLCAGGLAQRAHIVLLTVQGVSNTEIAERVGPPATR